MALDTKRFVIRQNRYPQQEGRTLTSTPVLIIGPHKTKAVQLVESLNKARQKLFKQRDQIYFDYVVR